MSDVFEGYERQYSELSANLTKKCTVAGALDGEQKKQKVSEIKAGIDDAESLIRKMDLEARSLPPNIKAVLLAKLREYKSDLNNLKTEVKKLVSGNAYAAARDELLESGMADALTPQQGVRRPPPAARQPTTATPNRKPAASTQSQPEEPPSPTSSTSSSKDQKEIVEALAPPSPKPKPAPQTAGSVTQKATATAAASESSSQTTPTEEAAPTHTDAAPSSSATEETNPPPKETVMEETIRVTRGRLRKARSAGSR